MHCNALSRLSNRSMNHSVNHPLTCLHEGLSPTGKCHSIFNPYTQWLLSEGCPQRWQREVSLGQSDWMRGCLGPFIGTCLPASTSVFMSVYFPFTLECNCPGQRYGDTVIEPYRGHIMTICGDKKEAIKWIKGIKATHWRWNGRKRKKGKNKQQSCVWPFNILPII